MACPTFFPPPVETGHSCLSSHSTARLACSQRVTLEKAADILTNRSVAAQSISRRVLPRCRMCYLRARCQGMGDGCGVALKMHLEMYMGKLKLCIECWLPCCAEHHVQPKDVGSVSCPRCLSISIYSVSPEIPL